MSANNDLRAAMIEVMAPAVSGMAINLRHRSSPTIFEALDKSHLACGGPYDPTAEEVIHRACAIAADAILAILPRWIADEPDLT